LICRLEPAFQKDFGLVAVAFVAAVVVAVVGS